MVGMAGIEIAPIRNNTGFRLRRSGVGGKSFVRPIGLLDRLVRLLIIFVALLLPALLIPALWVLALGSAFTGVQRLWYVYKHLDRGV